MKKMALEQVLSEYRIWIFGDGSTSGMERKNQGVWFQCERGEVGENAKEFTG